MGSAVLIGSESDALEPDAVSLPDEGAGEDCGSDDEPCDGIDEGRLLPD